MKRTTAYVLSLGLTFGAAVFTAPAAMAMEGCKITSAELKHGRMHVEVENTSDTQRLLTVAFRPTYLAGGPAGSDSSESGMARALEESVLVAPQERAKLMIGGQGSSTLEKPDKLWLTCPQGEEWRWQ